MMSFEQKINNLYESITCAKLDPEVGIRITHLTDNEHISSYAAEINPHKKIRAHYHKSGIEIYQVIEGEGVIYTGKSDVNRNISWSPPLNLKKGDCITVHEGNIHQLFNNSDERLIVIFVCPSSHMGEDRIIVKGIEINIGDIYENL